MKPTSTNGIFNTDNLDDVHAVIFVDGGRLFIEDSSQKSKGTFLEGRRIGKNARQIEGEDVITFGLGPGSVTVKIDRFRPPKQSKSR
jgi:hypothetical protein